MISSKARRIRVLVAFGTRPEAIKVAPIILALRKDRRFEVITVLTGQHREMVDQVLKLFKIRPDYDLDLMKDNQDLVSLSHRLLTKLQGVLRRHKPDWVLVQGDTTTAFVVAWAAFYEKIRVAHVEAGLRSYNAQHPFPEEVNRRLITQVASLHFAPTASARDNLLKEGIKPSAVMMTGNTGIDSLLLCLNRTKGQRYPEFDFLRESRKIIFVTCHRRESFGAPLRNICKALKEIVRRRPDVEIVYPVHLNPQVKNIVHEELCGISRVHLLEPLSYDRQVFLLSKASLILTDSGGIQEEAPTLGVPVLVLREVTERPEGVRLGFARVVGVRKENIVRQVLREMRGHDPILHYKLGSCPRISKNPYGDGKASQKILQALLKAR